MIHISDLSWTKRFSHPSGIYQEVGQPIDVVVLDIDMANRKLSLGHKQLEENPWDTFENVFPVGSYHSATVIKKDDKGFVVQLPYGLEAFSPLGTHEERQQSVCRSRRDTHGQVIEFAAMTRKSWSLTQGTLKISSAKRRQHHQRKGG
ncbi:MAG: S1 RNA-binding domain-containing protein [Saprospiraceae bacterium]